MIFDFLISVVDCDNERDLYETKLSLEPLGIKVISTKDFDINLTKEGSSSIKAETIYNEIYQSQMGGGINE